MADSITALMFSVWVDTVCCFKLIAFDKSLQLASMLWYEHTPDSTNLQVSWWNTETILFFSGSDYAYLKQTFTLNRLVTANILKE